MNSFLTPRYRSTMPVVVDNPTITPEGVLQVMANELEKEGAYDIAVHGNSLSFNGRRGIFNLKPLERPLTRRTRALNAINTGRITIEPQLDGQLWLTYELLFSETLVYVALVILCIAVVMVMAAYPWPCMTVIAIVGLLWLILGNTIYAVVWFKSFLKRCTTTGITN